MHSRNRESPAPGESPIDVPKVVEEKHIEILVKLFNQIYFSGFIPQEWLILIFNVFPKTQTTEGAAIIEPLV